MCALLPAPVAGRCTGQGPDGPCQMGGIGEPQVIGDGCKRSMGCSNRVPRAPGARFEPEDLRHNTKSFREASRHSLGSQTFGFRPFLQSHMLFRAQGPCQALCPMQIDRGSRAKSVAQREHGLVEVLLREPRERVRIGDLEVTFPGVLRPRKTKNLQRVPGCLPIRMAVEGAVQQYIARPSGKTTGKTRLFKRTAKHDRGVARDVSMPRQNGTWIEGLDAESDRPVAARAVWHHAINCTLGRWAPEGWSPPMSWHARNIVFGTMGERLRRAAATAATEAPRSWL